MAVQLLEQWLLKEQEKIRTNYQALNQLMLKEPDVIFIGDSIIEYFPLHELLLTQKVLVNRGIRGYKTDLLREHLEAHLFGQTLDKIFLLIGTNDIGKELSQKETVENMESILQEIMRLYPLVEIYLLSVLPVNENEAYKGTVYVRTNQKIQQLNQAYQEMSASYMNVHFLDVYQHVLDEAGQLKKEYTTDGLHLTISGYLQLAKALQSYL